MKIIYRNLLSSAFLLLGVFSLLSVVLHTTPELPVGEMEGQLLRAGWTAIVFAVCGLVAFFLSSRKDSRLLLSFAGAVSWSLIVLAGIEAVWGFRQLYGFTWSNHALFSLTGSFFNPGPYSGYLAMVLPVCLHEALKRKRREGRTIFHTILYYAAWVVMVLIVCLLPAGMSRSAWMAAGISCLFIYAVHQAWFTKLNVLRKKHPRRFLFIPVAGLVVMALVIVFFFSFKQNSANGRLFMWKITMQAIIQKPILGYGYGTFPAVYGDAQEAYFAKGGYTEREELVAGSPEYAFNEYLHITLENGLLLLVPSLLMTGICFYIAFKKKRIGICGAFISLLVFAFSSYPLRLPAFMIAYLMLIAVSFPGLRYKMFWVFPLLAGVVGFWLLKTNLYDECVQWGKARILYQAKAYEQAEGEFGKLYPALRKKAAFLFEYGHCLHKLEKFELSTAILEEASEHSGDPMIYNIIGKNYQQLGAYKEAEIWFRRSTCLLPGRIYPYYLLVKLYAEPDFSQPEKLRKAAEVVLTKEPKVQSTAIREMREEVSKYENIIIRLRKEE